jgi:hypothetical protein
LCAINKNDMKDARVMLKRLHLKPATPLLSLSLSFWPAWFVLSAGGILALAGVDSVLDFFGQSQAWDLLDPVFGLPFRYLLPLVGLAELSVAWLCLCSHKQTLSLGLLVWLVANFVIYRIGLWAMGWPHPWAFVGGLTDALNVSPELADIIILAILAYLVTGSGALLLEPKLRKFLHERLKSAKRGQALVAPKQIEEQTSLSSTEKTTPSPVDYVRFLKIPCPACGGRIEFPTNIFGEQISCPHCQDSITLQKPVNLKMSCGSCQGHIEFPDYAIRQKIPCPHCQIDITLTKDTAI